MGKGKSNGSRRRAAAVAAPPEVLSLVERFRENLESYRDPAYKEARLRREFLDPFFEALGWDVQNKSGHAEAYKDVVHEDVVKVGGSTEAPDYGFRVGGQRKFFVEAKKPSVAVETDVHPAYQLRRYAWSAKLPLSILTDFEETAVYDCRVRPRRSDKPSTARILYMTYEEYPERWGEVAAIFSKEAVLKGSFDRFAGKGRRRGTATVDEAFLEEIEGWRAKLARNLALRNARLSVRDLNEAVQRTIDRIIFLRMCEDRGVEPGGTLLGLVNGPKIYARLLGLFERADDKYNSGLFHFRAEAGRPAPDDLTPRLRVDDGVLADILRSLYYPESPYEFSVLGADILGQVYEQFLGKVIRLTAGHRAKVEEKPEVKKAGGVYYTPVYIVRYIVEETVGQLLHPIGKGDGSLLCEAPKGPSRQKTPVPFSPREASRLRILDPACGSGSFLIGAFERLLAWHRDWYVADSPEKHPKEIYRGAGGEWRLTVREKRRILLNNIFGVDIDRQAVEVTKLSLLLKVLEGENQDTLERQMRLFREERALPDLATNIKCGNSLIGPDFFDARQMDLFEEDEVHRVNAFDWSAEFPQILGPKVPKKRRGFDAVIGNPPYIFGEYLAEAEKPYLASVYRCAQRQADAYWLFIERCLRLARKGGRFSLIVPDALLARDEAEIVRELLLGERIESLFHCGLVFSSAVSALVFVVEKGGKPNASVMVHDWMGPGVREIGKAQQIDQRFLEDSPGKRFRIHVSREQAEVLQSLARGYQELRSLVSVSRGEEIGKKDTKERGRIPILVGEDVSRYHTAKPTRYVNRTSKDKDIYRAPKILVVKTGSSIVAAVDNNGFVTMQSLYGLHPDPESPYSHLYILGLLNSRLIRFWIEKGFTSYKKLFPQINQTTLMAVPIARLDMDSAEGSASHCRVVDKVQQMLDLSARLAKAKSVEARSRIERLIDATDRRIDRLVYGLYNLTVEEICIVEESLG